MLGQFNPRVKSRSVIPHCRTLLTRAALVLLPLAGVQAQAADFLEPWARCEPDELAREVVPASPNVPPPDQAPIQADAGQVESSPNQSLLQGNVSLSRGD